MKKAIHDLLHEDAFYTIAAPNGKVLEVANYNTDNGAAIQLWSYAGQPWQQWRFLSQGGESYHIQNRFTGKVIDLALRGTVQGTLLHQWSETSHKSQQWRLEPDAKGTRIRSVHADKCIDLAQMSTANGARAQIWADVDGGNQLWNIRRVPEKALVAPTTPKEQPSHVSEPVRKKDDIVKKINDQSKDKKRKKK